MEKFHAMEKFKIFIVDDDPWYGEILEYYLSMNPDYELARFTTAKACLSNLSRKPDLITLDYSLPDGNGNEVLKKIKQFNSNIPVIVISAQEDITTAIELLKAGASDYFVKDENTKDLLWNAVMRIREHRSLVEEVEHLREELGHKHDLGKLIKGNSPAIQKIFTLIEKAIKTNINVSITGETGTGKEVVAKAIHYNSDRKKQALVAVNMAAIPRELIESELFGHEKGSFTGALTRKTGKFEEANKGTLFLDEIAELDLSLQSKLLRVIQERELVRVGGNEKVNLDVRIIIATHKNLAEEVKKGNFREDLYYRIIGLPIELPPLRERGNDILLLAKYFLDEFCKQNKMPHVSLSTTAKDKLIAYNFPGNVRELKAIIDLAAVMCNDNMIEPDDISFNSVSTNNQFLSEEKTLKGYTIDIIKSFLKKYDNNVVKVADKLDIGKSTIYKMIQEKEIMI
jgi:two-component system response regulator AtoC